LLRLSAMGVASASSDPRVEPNRAAIGLVPQTWRRRENRRGARLPRHRELLAAARARGRRIDEATSGRVSRVALCPLTSIATAGRTHRPAHLPGFTGNYRCSGCLSRENKKRCHGCAIRAPVTTEASARLETSTDTRGLSVAVRKTASARIEAAPRPGTAWLSGGGGIRTLERPVTSNGFRDLYLRPAKPVVEPTPAAGGMSGGMKTSRCPATT
jgi:hypothetical protein